MTRSVTSSDERSITPFEAALDWNLVQSAGDRNTKHVDIQNSVHHGLSAWRCMSASLHLRPHPGAAQMREPSLMRRKMLWMSGLRHRMCARRPRVNIVDNATGQAKMGELVGVLGPSGNLFMSCCSLLSRPLAEARLL